MYHGTRRMGLSRHRHQRSSSFTSGTSGNHWRSPSSLFPGGADQVSYSETASRKKRFGFVFRKGDLGTACLVAVHQTPADYCWDHRLTRMPSLTRTAFAPQTHTHTHLNHASHNASRDDRPFNGGSAHESRRPVQPQRHRSVAAVLVRREVVAVPADVCEPRPDMVSRE